MIDAASPAERVRAAYARWHETRGGSAEDFVALMAPDIEMRTVLGADVPDEMAMETTGVDSARAYFSAILRDWDMVEFPTEEVVAQGDTVVWIGRCHWRSRSGIAEVNSPKVDIWHFHDGKAVDILEMFDSLAFARAIRLV
jgi:ketosteroid isomerase-like protein